MHKYIILVNIKVKMEKWPKAESCTRFSPPICSQRATHMRTWQAVWRLLVIIIAWSLQLFFFSDLITLCYFWAAWKIRASYSLRERMRRRKKNYYCLLHLPCEIGGELRKSDRCCWWDASLESFRWWIQSALQSFSWSSPISAKQLFPFFFFFFINIIYFIIVPYISNVGYSTLQCAYNIDIVIKVGIVEKFSCWGGILLVIVDLYQHFRWMVCFILDNLNPS